ncbi:hypothetical protein K8O68_02680 [Salipaludibacillus sp. CUR1]|uniref:hypothetical protein n=1 Tax=Salipaludibacillus sp. CUR1 TaxID=2820003 RepID=UPI001E3D0875|nr:hypothetical protein [Salipaludibacillus sp. CUR1]MCE7791326.1 hypothetical protein [Salipaludibacillus sp. CUR1]
MTRNGSRWAIFVENCYTVELDDYTVELSIYTVESDDYTVEFRLYTVESHDYTVECYD